MVFILSFTHDLFRESVDPLPQRYEWDNRFTSSRRIGMKTCHRVLSSPNISECYKIKGDCFVDRMRERSSWRPYRIPRPKLVGGGHCSGRVRTISATLHEEIEKLVPTVDTSQVAIAADAFHSMAISEGRPKSSVSLHFHRLVPHSLTLLWLRIISRSVH